MSKRANVELYALIMKIIHKDYREIASWDKCWVGDVIDPDMNKLKKLFKQWLEEE